MARTYFAGMGQAVADRTINRKGEGWDDVARRVARGNAAITQSNSSNLERHIGNATILMSGRHLQHGDETQPTRNIELYSNCSTSAQRSILFYLLLNGSGVGTSYDDAVCLIDFRMMPKVYCTIREDHPDNLPFPTTEDVLTDDATVFRVPDSREGWAQAVEMIEVMAFEERANETLILDFSDVRENGRPIDGMQGRPASGPGPIMHALTRIATVRESDWAPWRQAMQIDHELAECVLVGGARRAARIATKYWKDKDILEFVRVKNEGGLWSANNSIGVDAEFWANPGDLFDAVVESQYGTGEPGFLNLDLLAYGEDRPTITDINNLSGKYQLSDRALELRAALAVAAAEMKYPYICNPCGEIRLHAIGGYCVIADVVPYFSESDDDAEDAFREATIALLRTNMLTALYQGEVDRTNRIGVGFTGIHEYAWKRFGLTWRDLVDEGDDIIVDGNGNTMKAPGRSLDFWLMMSRFASAVEDTAMEWCLENEVAFPSTLRTVKPAGTTSKLFGLTEGAHLPPMREYLRWVQFRSDDPLVNRYKDQGYPVRVLETYSGTTIVGFPTQPLICALGMDVTTAPEATPEEQFRWVRLIETFWLGRSGGNQVSYTLKYDPNKTSKEDYRALMLDNLPKVRAMSVMPSMDMTGYEYQPEEPISAAQYAELKRSTMKEDVDRVHVDCLNGACPISFDK